MEAEEPEPAAPEDAPATAEDAPAAAEDATPEGKAPFGAPRPGSPLYLLLLALACGLSLLLGSRESLTQLGPPWALPVAIPLGVVLLGWSVAFTGISLRKAGRLLPSMLRGGLGLSGLLRWRTLHYVAVAFVEELLWRAGIQHALPLDPAPAILIVACVFAFLHGLFDTGEVKLLRVLDLFLFACVLGVLFHVTGNVYFVAVLHFIRNQCLAVPRPPKTESQP